jgi:hypothetical protein
MMSLLLNSVLNTALLTGLFAATDKGIAVIGLQRPYYAVHVLHNAAIVALTAADVADSMTDFPAAALRSLNWPAIWLCYALHLYHLLLYWRSFRFDDWLHHALMIGVALPLGCIIGGGTLVGFSLFFTTGLPGGISYMALWLERNGCLRRATEKRINRAVNVWLRAPGCVAHAVLTATYMLTYMDTLSDTQLVGGLLTAALTGWNGLYFMEQAVAAHAQLAA